MESTTLAVIVTAIFGCTGFWAFIQYLVQRKSEKDSKQGKMLKGLGHDRICYLAERYIHDGYITTEDYENLHDFLYLPYKELGGNGTAEKLMNEVEKLPIKDGKDEKVN